MKDKNEGVLSQELRQLLDAKSEDKFISFEREGLSVFQGHLGEHMEEVVTDTVVLVGLALVEL